METHLLQSEVDTKVQWETTEIWWDLKAKTNTIITTSVLQDQVETLKALKHPLIQTFKIKTHISLEQILMESQWATGHHQETTQILLAAKTILTGEMFPTQIICLILKTRIKIITTPSSSNSRILMQIKQMAVTRFNKCNNSLLSKDVRISLSVKDSLITKLIILWIIKTRPTIRRMEVHPMRIIVMGLQSKKTFLSKKCKMQE